MSELNTPNFPPEEMQPEAVNAAAAPLKLDVTVRPIEPMGNLLGFASVKINDAFVVENFRVCTGEKGMFVNMPAQQDKNGEWHDTFFPITAEAREQLNTAVIGAYSRKIMEMQQTIDKTKEAMTPDRTDASRPPSLKATLRQSGEKARNQPNKPGDPNGGHAL